MPHASGRHRHRLRQSVHHDEPPRRRRDRQQRRRFTVVADATVDLVTQNPPPGLVRERRDLFQLRARVDGTRGIARRVQHEAARPRRSGARQVRRRDLEAPLARTAHRDRLGARDREHFVIAGPGRRRHQHLVAFAEQRKTGVEQRLLRSRRNDDIARVPRRRAVRAARLLGDDRPQRLDPRHGRVPRRALVERPMRRLDHERGRREVRLSGAEIDDRPALRTKSLRARRRRDRGGLAKPVDVGRRSVVRHASAH